MFDSSKIGQVVPVNFVRKIMLNINSLLLAAILILTYQVNLAVGGRGNSLAIVDNNPCSHLNNNDPYQRVLEEVDGPGGEKFFCCKCKRNHKVISPCEKGNFASTNCAACEPGSEIDKNFHFDKQCVAKPTVAPTTVGTTPSTRDVEIRDRFVTKAPQKIHVHSKPATSSKLVKASNFATASAPLKPSTPLATSPIFPTDLPYRQSTSAAPPHVNAASQPPGPSLEYFLAPKWIALFSIIPLLGLGIFLFFGCIWWRRSKKKQRDRTKVEASEVKENLDLLERGSSTNAHFTVVDPSSETSVKLGNPGLGDGPNEVRQSLLHSGQNNAVDQPDLRETENQNEPCIVQDSAPATETILKLINEEPEQSQKLNASPFTSYSNEETESQVADNAGNHPELEIRKLRKFFSAIGGKHISFKQADARKFGREFGLTEAQLLECQRDSYNCNRSAGEMMVHVIDAVHGARGSDFTFSSVIEYFRENLMVLLVEKLVDHMSC